LPENDQTMAKVPSLPDQHAAFSRGRVKSRIGIHFCQAFSIL
jgi:hypothetical protein